MPSNVSSETQTLLKFSHGNAKIGGHVAIFSLPAGHSCPGAHACLSKADRIRGSLTDGPGISYRCYAASQEAAFPNVRRIRWENFDLLKRTLRSGGADEAAHLIYQSLLRLDENATKVRIHGSGDFFSKDYFDAWMQVAMWMPDMQFYAYTKALNFWAGRLTGDEGIPTNVTLIASHGGKHDHLIEKYDLRSCTVVMHPEDAAVLNLEIDHDDTIAQDGKSSFALLIHGGQPANSKSGAALKRLRQEGVKFSYGKK